ncbi:alpha/beta-hydrolase [Cladorrhinum sp. PSN332]|nr:alpha/beta-hydrolase [Cladorrhinum sp. PSN332]
MTTHQTARTLYTSPTPSGTTFAYRRLGTPSSSSSTPLLILTHFRGVTDKFDPLLINLLSASRPVIQVDYSGVGLSTGPVAKSVKQSAADILAFLSLIDEKEVDILGFSLGGMVAQLVALNAPQSGLGIKVRKLILAGTTPSAGPGVEATTNTDVGQWAGGQNVVIEAFKVLFFPQTKEGDVAAEQWWDRIGERGELNKLKGEKTATWLSDGYLDGAVGLKGQLEQLGKWGSVEGSEGEEGSFARLGELVDVPVLVVNGHDDYMTPTANSFTVQQKLPNAQLIVYPNSGHGAIFQYATQFAKDALLFLGA